jgi:2-dehydro-3-deoxygluconokinase
MQNLSVSTRPAEECRYDLISLGEVMLRLDPGDRRIRNAREFDAWEGGGEYNVARGLRKAFGLRTGIVTALADNEVGRLIEDFIMQGGVDTSGIIWRDYDGLGRNVRNGLNFTERGFGVRGAIGISDRGNTAVSQLKPGDIDWDALFSQGVRWFHTGGIFAGLSTTTAVVAEEAMVSARKHGTVVSFDLNFRPSMWRDIGGEAKAVEVTKRLTGLVDVMIDFLSLVKPRSEGSSVEGALTLTEVGDLARQAGELYPNLSVVATTLRNVRSASINDLDALAWSRREGIATSIARPGLQIFDRVGGGDSFASGLIYGLMEMKTLDEALELGAAHAAIAMTTPGDTSKAVGGEAKQLAWVDYQDPTY